MVLLIAKFNKLCSKLENLHHHRRQSSEQDSLQAFFSAIGLSKLPSPPEVASFSWLRSCFELVPVANKAFAKLVVAIDHPASNWSPDSVEKYLNYSLKLLERFNSISASLARLSRAKVPLAHGASLAEGEFPQSALKHLKSIDSPAVEESRGLESSREEAKSHRSNKEEAIQRALMAMEDLGLWVCRAVLSSVAKGGTTTEVREVNEWVGRLVGAIEGGKSSSEEAGELRSRLEALEKGLEGLEKEIDQVFTEVLRARNHLISGFQHLDIHSG